MAEGILQKKVKDQGLDIEIDSCGTSGWHIGESPDKRAIQIAREYNVDISGLQARQFSKSDFDSFDHILVMDATNREDILQLAKNDEQRDKVSMILNYLKDNSDRAVPDPYFGGNDGFHHVFELLDLACDGFIKSLD